MHHLFIFFIFFIFFLSRITLFILLYFVYYLSSFIILFISLLIPSTLSHNRPMLGYLRHLNSKASVTMIRHRQLMRSYAIPLGITSRTYTCSKKYVTFILIFLYNIILSYFILSHLIFTHLILSYLILSTIPHVFY